MMTLHMTLLQALEAVHNSGVRASIVDCSREVLAEVCRPENDEGHFYLFLLTLSLLRS